MRTVIGPSTHSPAPAKRISVRPRLGGPAGFEVQPSDSGGRRAPQRVLGLLARSLFRVALVGLVVAACRPAPEGPRVLRLIRHTAGAQGFRLNEPIQFFFSAPLEVNSITGHSARIERSDGELAEGTWVVNGRSLRFEPRPATLPDLSDSGFQPGNRYGVVLVGFPEPDGLRARDGAPLERSFRTSIETVGGATSGSMGGAASSAETLFFDPTPYAHRLKLEAYEIDPGGDPTFVCHEPLDPRSLRSEDFEIRIHRVDERGRPETDANGWPSFGPPIKVSAQLVENGRGSGGARLKLRNPEGWIPERTYRLTLPMPPEFGLRDLGGHPVEVENLDRSGRYQDIVIAEWGATRWSPTLREEFRTTVYRSNRTLPGTDGTAHWGDDSVSIRYPRAVGTGQDGDVVLGVDEGRKDLHAITLSVPADLRCELAAGGGPTVLRTQGSMRIDGVLSRRARERPELDADGAPVLDLDGEPLFTRVSDSLVFRNEDDPHGDWNPSDPPPGRRAPGPDAAVIEESVSEFLERAQRLGRDWTVLIVGGDLWLDGSIDVEGGLLIVLGGRLRSGNPLQTDLLAHAEVLGLSSRGVGGTGAEEKGLWMDPPKVNPLIRPMRFGVYSKPLPPQGGVRRWKHYRIHGRRGSGGIVLRFEGEPNEAHPAPWIESHPTFLHGSPTLRFQLELTMPAGHEGAPWDPPQVDAIEIHWETDF